MHSNTNRHMINNSSLQFMSEMFKMTYPNIKCKPTLTKEIQNMIKSLKTKNSHGYDEISTKLLKISCPFISSPLNYICNKTLYWRLP
jgi:hypothetical protein